MNRIESLKQRLEAKTSEELFGIDKQPPQQCPKIDKVIGDLERLYKEIQWLLSSINSTDDIREIKSLVGDIDWIVGDIDKSNEMNELRTQIETIRHWGESWKDLAKCLLNDLKVEEDLVHYFSRYFQIKHDTQTNG